MISPVNNLWRRLRGRPPLRTIRLRGLPRFRIETHGAADTIVSRTIELEHSWEYCVTSVVIDLLRQEVDFVDAGANIGWYTLVAGRALAHRGQVHSFEPEPANLARLRANVALNRLDNVTVNGWGLTSHQGVARLYLNASNFGDNSLFGDANRTRSVEVPLQRLDDYAGLSSDRPLVMKIDVQGSEFDLLLGAERLLSTHRREIVLVFEMADSMLQAAGTSAAGLAGYLHGLGFAPALIDRNVPRVVPMSWERAIETIRLEPGREGDIVAYRRIDGLMAGMFAAARAGRQPAAGPG